MFKILAVVGALAGGTTYGLYAHTDLFQGMRRSECPLEPSAEIKPCCQDECGGRRPTAARARRAARRRLLAARPRAAAAKWPPCFASKTVPVSTASPRRGPVSPCAIECSRGLQLWCLLDLLRRPPRPPSPARRRSLPALEEVMIQQDGSAASVTGPIVRSNSARQMGVPFWRAFRSKLVWNPTASGTPRSFRNAPRGTPASPG